ncbi:MAG: hypothetical protein MHM6MM_005940 [Cercozoa sp. M6MM]
MEPSDVFAYLKEVRHVDPKRVLSLYSDEWATLAVFRALSPLAKSVVMRLVTVSQPLTPEHVRQWFRHDTDFEQAFEQLQELALLHNQNGIVLTPQFGAQLGRALCRRGAHRVRHLRDLQQGTAQREIDAAATDKWDLLVETLLGENQEAENIQLLRELGFLETKTEAPRLFQVSHSNQVETSASNGTFDKSDKAFSFLFAPTRVQVWKLLTSMFKVLQDDWEAHDAALKLVFRLSMCDAGTLLSQSELSPHQLNFAKRLERVGILAFFDSDITLTSVGGTLCAGEGPRKQGYLIVETTFRVLCYSNSRIHRALLSLFARIDVLLPGLTVAKITKRSIQPALMAGITAAQIAQFLRTHLHPRQLTRLEEQEDAVEETETVVVGGVPSNVIDMLHLWERERNRLRMQPASMISQFASEHELKQALQVMQGGVLHVLREPETSVTSTRVYCTAAALERLKHWRIAQRQKQQQQR